jgi:hypothetical protein
MGLSTVLCACGDSCDGSSVSAGVTEEVDLRGGMVIWLWSGRCVLFFGLVEPDFVGSDVDQSWLLVSWDWN